MVRLVRPHVHRQVASEVVAHVVEAASEEVPEAEVAELSSFAPFQNLKNIINLKVIIQKIITSHV